MSFIMTFLIQGRPSALSGSQTVDLLVGLLVLGLVSATAGIAIAWPRNPIDGMLVGAGFGGVGFLLLWYVGQLRAGAPNSDRLDGALAFELVGIAAIVGAICAVVERILIRAGSSKLNLAVLLLMAILFGLACAMLPIMFFSGMD